MSTLQVETVVSTRFKVVFEQIKHLLHHQENQPEFITNGNLFNGYAGIVYYYFSLLKAYPEGETEAYTALEKLVESYNSQDNEASKYMTFCSGLSGFYFLIQKLVEQDYLDEEFLEEVLPINELIFKDTQKLLTEENTDFLHGASGQMLYLLNSKDPNRAYYLSTLIDELLKLAVVDEKGLRFPNSTVKLFQNTDNSNMSLSHGNAGILLVLLNIYNAGIEQEKLGIAIRQGIDYFINHYHPRTAEASLSAFPLLINQELTKKELIDGDFYAENYSWCYGDLAVIWLLYQGSLSFKQPAYADIADQVGKTMATRLITVPELGIKINSHFCHGTSGIALFLDRLYKFSGHEIYHEAAQVWLESTLDHLEKDLNNPDFMNKPSSFGLLEGVAGAMFVLAAAEHDDMAANWTDMFLLS
jgi:lantibiotic modifying enzyme